MPPETQTPTAAAPAAAPTAKELTLEEIQGAIGEAVTKALKAEHPEQKDQITLKGVQEIIALELEKFKADSKAVTKDNIGELVDLTIKSTVATIRKAPARVSDPADAASAKHVGGDRVTALGVEMPYALCKGSLPLHYKQLLNILLKKDKNDGLNEGVIATGKQYDDHLWNGIRQFGAKALTAGGTGTGAEFIPRSLDSELHRRLYLESQLAQSFLAQEVQMPTDPYDFPLQTTDPTFKANNVENRDAAATDIGTSSFTLTSKTFMALVQYSYKVDEDSIIPILPLLLERLGKAAARALENALINGDTTSTHQDSDITDADDVAKQWKGFRKLALAVAGLKTDITSGGFSRANLLAVLKLLGKYGVRTQDILWIVGPKAWNALLGLDEFVNFYQRGGVGSFVAGGPPPAPWGGSIIVSDQMRENLNASGVYDGSTTTKNGVIALNRSGFVFGSRREFMVEVERNIRSQTHDIVASFRKAFSPVETPSASISTVAMGYNATA